MVSAPDDVSDAHVHVVSHNAQVIRRNAVRAQQHEILEFIIGEFDAPEDCIFEGSNPTLRHGKAHRADLSRCSTPACLFS